MKKYRARNVKEGMEMIRGEMGENAVLLSTRTIENGVEMLAALDMDIDADAMQDFADNMVARELKEVKASVNKLLEWARCSDVHSFSKLYAKLLSSGLTKENATKISARLGPQFDASQEMWTTEELNTLREEISLLIKSSPIKIGKKPTVIALIGPTGVGKTTTIAKLVSNFVVFDRLKASLITIDTYRVAAIEQLRTFADIINIPLEVIMEPTELPLAIEKFHDSDVIFIDTAGRSQKNEGHLKELASFFNTAKLDETHLVLSTTTKFCDIDDEIRKFSILRPDKLLFTKLDETTTYGGILDASLNYEKPISYLTTGQSVPNDIEKAEPQKIADYIVSE